ncbi:MAG: HAD family phosphatase [Defluviitaleaceae bacterium]|nr:HAD family phosphatase [Defluviitaleaceae bacterium]
MIKNIVFDLGRVLLSYDPAAMLSEMYDSRKADALMDTVYLSDKWSDLDKGELTFAGAVEYFSALRPDLRQEVENVFSAGTWEKLLYPLEDTVALLRGLKKSGYMIYFLSNFSKEGFDIISPKRDFFKLADGWVISAHVRVIKPDPAIYELLLEKYSLAPAETVFIDDLPGNVAAAEGLGIHAVLFENAADCREKLERIIAKEGRG